MTRDDLRILCTALGFMVANLKDLPLEQQATRAKTYARVIESGCYISASDALGASNENLGDEGDPEVVDRVIERYKAELVNQESARLPEDRQALLVLCRRLLIRQVYRQQRDFLTLSDDDKIADRILELAEEEIAIDAAET